MSIETEIRALPVAEGLDEEHAERAARNCQEFRECMKQRVTAAAIDRAIEKAKEEAAAAEQPSRSA